MAERVAGTVTGSVSRERAHQQHALKKAPTLMQVRAAEGEIRGSSRGSLRRAEAWTSSSRRNSSNSNSLLGILAPPLTRRTLRI
jgi:hypothetical protein